MSSATALEVTGVSKIFGRSIALRGVSLYLSAGETLALLGANGSGKTTLLKIISGAMTPSSGRVVVHGVDAGPTARNARTYVGLLSSDTYVYDDLTAAENMRFTVTLAGRSASTAEIDEHLRRARLGEHAARRVRTFSSGMKRRLAIARVQILDPRIVLLDEPYNSLDAQGAEGVDVWIANSKRAGGVVVVATHDAARALAFVDRVAVLQRGTLVYLGPALEYAQRVPLHVG